MLWVVTGAAGHIGANLVRSLLDRGETVRAVIHRNAAALEGLGVETVSGDVGDPESLKEAFRDAGIVVNLAARISISRDAGNVVDPVNVAGTRNVVRVCLERGGLRLVHFSSIHAIAQPSAGEVTDENSPLVVGRRAPAYDRSKAQGERVVLEAVGNGLNAVILAPTAVVGPYDFGPSYFGRVLLGLARRRMPVLVRGGFDWVDVRDIVEATLRVALAEQPSVKYLLSGHWHSIMEVSRMAGRITGLPAASFAAPMPIARVCGSAVEQMCKLTGRPPLFTACAIDALSQHPRVSHERAAAELGYAPRPFAETLADAYSWFKANGYVGGDCTRMGASS